MNLTIGYNRYEKAPARNFVHHAINVDGEHEGNIKLVDAICPTSRLHLFELCIYHC
jgi:hypothetical protein